MYWVTEYDRDAPQVSAATTREGYRLEGDPPRVSDKDDSARHAIRISFDDVAEAYIPVRESLICLSMQRKKFVLSSSDPLAVVRMTD